MIKHIVMWKLHDEANGMSKKKNAIELKKRLESLISKIDAINSMEVGIGYMESEGAIFDIVLTTSHESKDKLTEYSEHPEHQKVVAFVKSIVAERRVVDYKIN
ncbi:MAG: Dabb family protein [Balneolaceae bacterium]